MLSLSSILKRIAFKWILSESYFVLFFLQHKQAESNVLLQHVIDSNFILLIICKENWAVFSFKIGLMNGWYYALQPMQLEVSYV